jgi:hypothetical protein
MTQNEIPGWRVGTSIRNTESPALPLAESPVHFRASRRADVPCGVQVALKDLEAGASRNWAQVTCRKCLLHKSGPVPVHFLLGSMTSTQCGLTWRAIKDLQFREIWAHVEDWAKVTCKECLLEQPAETVPTPGVVEYRTPENVKAVDAGIEEADRLLLAGAQKRERERLQQEIAVADSSLAAVEATYRTLSQNIEYLKERRAEARAEHEDAVRRLSELQEALRGLGVPGEGSEVSEPENGSQEAKPVRYRVLRGYRAGEDATFMRFGNAYGTVEAPITVIFDGETVERTYSRKYLREIS